MTRTPSRRSGFTLIEMLVASLLMGMLVTILTMVFNASSIAWRTGRAGVAQLSKARRQLSYAQIRADALLPRVVQGSAAVVGRVTGAWDANGDVRRRAVARLQSSDANFRLSDFAAQDFNSAASSLSAQPWQEVQSIERLRAASADTYTVGVLSYGPDGAEGTSDDIDTWPDEVE